MNFSVVIVSFHSFHLIENIIKNFNEKTNIIIIENSKDIKVKNKIEALYKNVKVIIPEKNLGFGPGINLGIKLSKNEYVLCLVADVKISKISINSLSNCIKKFNDFAIISPTFFNEEIYKNYSISSKKKNLTDPISIEYGIREVDFVDGAAFLINKFIMEKIGYMDENFFFYFEQEDLCLRLNKHNQKIYICDKIKFSHKGLGSSHSSVISKIKILRNWHYSWGKFYFYKKHYGYLIGLKKTLPNFVRAIKYIILSVAQNKPEELRMHKAELKGLINSYLLNKSFYRLLE